LEGLRGSARRAARVCEGLRGSARVCEGLRGSARVCEGLRGSARVCEGMRGYARVCEGLQGSAKAASIREGLRGMEGLLGPAIGEERGEAVIFSYLFVYLILIYVLLK
jgi:hypothetical protein